MPSQALPAASLKSSKRLPADRAMSWASIYLICMALWSIKRAIFRVEAAFLPALSEEPSHPQRRRLGLTQVPSAEDEVSEHLPAIDRDVLAGDPAGERRAQEQSDLRYLLRAAQPAKRDASEDAAIEVGIVQSGALPRAAGKL